ncbi:MAG: hypothetical protein ACFB50_07945 [Rubrobacteraceae bacterium]
MWRAELPEPSASEPRYWRPMLIVRPDDFTPSRIWFEISLILTTNPQPRSFLVE